MKVYRGASLKKTKMSPPKSGTVAGDGHPVQAAEEGPGGGAAEAAGALHPDPGAPLRHLHC